MPPRATQVRPTVQRGVPTAPHRPSGVRPGRSRTQGAGGPGEYFDLENVSGTDSDNDPQLPQPSGGGTPEAGPSQESGGVNVTDLPEMKTAAADIHYFFEIVDKKRVCKECR